jgi:hypothetical protein
MDNNQKQTNLANNSIILATLLAIGSLFIPHEAPLESSRPVEPRIIPQAASVKEQDVYARLWQDPFAAVANTLKKPDLSKPKHQCRHADPHCKIPLPDAGQYMVIGVTMTGAPYFEDGESRQRTRYAVLSGLHARGFVPADEGHIGYFMPQTDENTPLPNVVPFERFDLPHSSSHIVVLWLNEDVFAEKPLTKFSRLVKILNLQGFGSSPIRIIGPHFSGTLRQMARDAAGAVEKMPCLEAAPATDAGEALRVRATANQQAAPEWLKNLKETIFYSAGPTVEDSKLLPRLATDPNVHDYFRNHGLCLYRTVATDHMLVRAIVKELQLRGVEPGQPMSRWLTSGFRRYQPLLQLGSRLIPGKQHLALIYEEDTLYGESFPSMVKQILACDRGCDWIHNRAYLRGLDGRRRDFRPVAAPDREPDCEVVAAVAHCPVKRQARALASRAELCS